MQYVYFVMNTVCFLALLTLAVHIINNTVLDKASRIWFTIALIDVALATSAEAHGTYFEFTKTASGLHPFLICLEFILTPLFPVFLSLACKIRKPAFFMLIFEGIHALLELVLLRSGLVFSISEDITYVRGKLYFIYIIGYVSAYLYLIIVFVLISRSFRNRDLRTIIFTFITAVSALLPSVINPDIRTAYLACTMLAILTYIYYQDLAEQDTQLKIKSHSEYMNRELIQTLSSALEAKDEYTKGHSLRVAEYSSIIAEQMHFSEEEIARLHFAATLHDIGKIGVPDTVLNKPGRLTNDEYNIIKMHPVIGSDILKNVEAIAFTSDVARFHHERYDGTGYPDGLKGTSIPLEARIVALADTYDAMTSKRIYRQNAFSDDEIRKEFLKNKGIQFDPEITDLFIDALDRGLFDEISNSISPSDNEDLGVNILTAKEELDTAIRTMTGSNSEISIDDIIKAVEKLGAYDGSLSVEGREFAHLFAYINNLCLRYNHSCFVVLVSLEPEGKSFFTKDDMQNALEAVELSAKQAIRSTDICTRFSQTKYLIVLVEAGEQNVSEIMKRIFNSFYKIQGRSGLVPRYEFGKISNPTDSK